MIKKTLLSIIAALAVPMYSGAQSNLPHYLNGVPTKYEDEVDKLTAKFITYDSLQTRYPNKPATDFFNFAITTTADVHGKKVEFIFKNYHQEFAKDNPSKQVVAHYTPSGREELTAEQFELVKNDIIATQKIASQLAYEKHKNIEKAIVSAQEKLFREEKLLKDNESLADKLNMVVAPGVTVADALYLPRMNVTDFVPKKHIFGPIPALGMAYLNSGWVYYDPKARVLDHIDAIPLVLIHECQHNNVKLQRLPYADAFDAELWASLPILEKSDAIEFLIHPYYADVRHVSKVLFSFDSNLAFDKCFFVTAGGIKINKERMRLYINQIHQISKVIEDTALNGFMQEYYAHFSFWSTVNEELKDKNAAFKIYMYMAYEPTLLGGPQKTLKWLEKNKLVIEEASRKAMQRIGDKKNKPGEITIMNQEELLQNLRRAGIKVEDPKALYDIYEKLVALGYIKR